MARGDRRIVDFSGTRPLGRRARRAAQETADVLDGSVFEHPITVFVHLKGDGPPFPAKWQWGKIVLNGTRPAWRRLKLRERKTDEKLRIPDDAVTTGTARPIHRSELSAFCPNPRRTLIIPMVSGETEFFLGVPRDSVSTIIAALERTHRKSRRVD